jgi:hypothetical protein
MEVIRHILGLIPPWAKPVLLGLVLGYALWRAVMGWIAGYLRKRYFEKFDNRTLSILPITITKLPEIAKLRKKSEPKTLRSLRRLRELGLAKSIHVEELPDDYLWVKLSPPY